GATGIGHLYIDIPTRTRINIEAMATQMARINQPFDFYIRKTFPWKSVVLISVVLIATIIAALCLSDVISFSSFK
ncbi:hypothetical protein ACFLYQ_05045, partial [Chloroflexota bacterium]